MALDEHFIADQADVADPEPLRDALLLIGGSLNLAPREGSPIADKAQQLLSPARINNITSVNTSNQLDVANLPIGRNGVVEVSTNFLNWSTAATITTTNLDQSVLVNVSGDQGFYRLRFPFLWSWP